MDEDWTEPAGNDAEPDEVADAEYLDGPDDLTNDEFRSLLRRSLLADDVGATEQLHRYLLGKFWTMAKRVPKWDRDELVSHLLEKTYPVARRVIAETYRKPRNYVMRAASHALLDFLEEQYRVRRDMTAGSPARADAIGSHDIDNLTLVHKFKRRFRESETGFKVAQVIELLYVFGLNLTEAEACTMLHFGPRETETVLRTLRRWRTAVDSPLHDIVRTLIERDR